MAYGYRFGDADPHSELERLQGELNHLFSGFTRSSAGNPPLKVYVGHDDLLIMTEVPGATPDQIKISVIGETLTLGVNRPLEASKDGGAFHRRERRGGQVSRTIEIPFRVDAEHVEANVQNGVLQVRLPRAAEDKPRSIAVKSA